MPMLADTIDAVVGVDTHRDTHCLALLSARGAPIATTTVANSDRGFHAALDFITDHAPGPRVALAVEGTRSYGIGLARAATAAGLMVLEVDQPARTQRRGKGKSDPIDAHLAAVAALNTDLAHLATPRADGDREALRILLSTREELTTTTTAQTNRLRALLLTGPDPDRVLARAKLNETTLSKLTRRRVPAGASRAEAVRHAEIRRLTLALRGNARALAENCAHLREIVDELAPGLTDRRGIGPVTAAAIVVAFSHPGRCRNDAAFAALAGTSPLPASSGRTVRHRLNRGGDRSLNRAIHTIALTRARCCPTTRAYIERRRAEGKTPREIRRCLKRYITRELFKALNTTAAY